MSKAFDEAFAEIFADEIQEWRKAGYKQGYRIGCEEAADAITVNMLQLNYTIEQICNITKVTPERVKALAAENCIAV